MAGDKNLLKMFDFMLFWSLKNKSIKMTNDEKQKYTIDLFPTKEDWFAIPVNLQMAVLGNLIEIAQNEGFLNVSVVKNLLPDSLRVNEIDVQKSVLKDASIIKGCLEKYEDKTMKTVIDKLNFAIQDGKKNLEMLKCLSFKNNFSR